MSAKLKNGRKLWYKDAIIYELSVRAFHDSNGDGIGDFPGLIQKLDYLEDLGINTIWLLPLTAKLIVVMRGNRDRDW